MVFYFFWFWFNYLSIYYGLVGSPLWYFIPKESDIYSHAPISHFASHIGIDTYPILIGFDMLVIRVGGVLNMFFWKKKKRKNFDTLSICHGFGLPIPGSSLFGSFLSITNWIIFLPPSHSFLALLCLFSSFSFLSMFSKKILMYALWFVGFGIIYVLNVVQCWIYDSLGNIAVHYDNQMQAFQWLFMCHFYVYLHHAKALTHASHWVLMAILGICLSC